MWRRVWGCFENRERVGDDLKNAMKIAIALQCAAVDVQCSCCQAPIGWIAGQAGMRDPSPCSLQRDWPFPSVLPPSLPSNPQLQGRPTARLQHFTSCCLPLSRLTLLRAHALSLSLCVPARPPSVYRWPAPFQSKSQHQRKQQTITSNSRGSLNSSSTSRLVLRFSKWP